MYDEEKLVDAIWRNPQAVAPLNWTLINNGTLWATNQYPDGSAGGKRSDRTTLKKGTDSRGLPTIWVHCNGDFGAFQGGTIWGFLKWLNNTNELIAVLDIVGKAYGIEPDYSGYTEEQIQRAKQRRSEKELLKEIADTLSAELIGANGATAREYLQRRGLKPTERLGAWNSAIKAKLLETLPKKYNITKSALDKKLSSELLYTFSQDDSGKWHNNIDDYQLAIPYTNGAGNVTGFCLRMTNPDKAGVLKKTIKSVGMAKGGYCGALKGGEEPVLLVEGELDAEAMKQNGITNVLALAGMAPTENKEDAEKSIIDTLLRYNTKKIVYLPDYEYKDVKNGHGEVIGKEPYPSTTATLNTIEKLLPRVTGKMDGSGFVSIRIANLETPYGKEHKAKVDAEDYLKECSAAELKNVIDNAIAWYEYELQAVTQQYADNIDLMAAAAIEVYCKIDDYAARSRLKDDITAARYGYMAKLKEAGLSAAALTQIDRHGKNSTYAERMAAVVSEMGKEHTADGMAALLTKAQRIQHADTYNAFASQVYVTREDMHKLVAQKPEYMQTTWALYREYKNKATQAYEKRENRKISFAPAAVSVMAAPTNHGKTLVLLQTAINLTKTTGKKFLYLSIENDAEQLYVRAITAYMGNVWRADEPNPRGEVRAAIKGADLPTELFDSNKRSINIGDYIQKYWTEIAPRLALVRTEADIDAVVNNVEAQVEAWRNDGEEVGGIFIDYLQLLHYPALRAHSRTDEVKGICDRLNDMAKATRLPVIVAAQFNRDATKAGGMKLDGVELANLGESAGIENIAEDVYLIWQIDKISKEDYTDSKGNFEVKANLRRSKRCFTNVEDADSQRCGYIYIENLKARDYATGGYCLLPFNGAAGAITSIESEY